MTIKKLLYSWIYNPINCDEFIKAGRVNEVKNILENNNIVLSADSIDYLYKQDRLEDIEYFGQYMTIKMFCDGAYYIDIALEDGDERKVKWLISKMSVQYSLYSKQMAILNDYKELVKWVEKNGKMRNSTSVSADLLIKTGRVEDIKKLIDNNIQMRINTDSMDYLYNNNHLDDVAYFHDKMGINLTNNGSMQLDIALEEGDENRVKFLVSKMQAEYSLYAKQMAMKNGHINLVLWVESYGKMRNNVSIRNVHYSSKFGWCSEWFKY